jgi:hypothetical protein
MGCVSQVDIRKGRTLDGLSSTFHNGNQIRGSVCDLSGKGTQFDRGLHSRTSHFVSITAKYVFLTSL